jgi:hypothetical protein
VLNGKRDSLPFLLLLDKHFPELLDTAIFDAKAVVKRAKKLYRFDNSPEHGKYGKFIRKEEFDGRFAKAEN